jgi:hypothetical protein
VLFCRTYRGRPLDDDNLAGAFKPVRDELVRARVIEGDEPERLVAIYEQRKKIRDGCDWLCIVGAADKWEYCP